MTELATTKHHYRLLYALAAAAGLGLGLALIAFCDAWFSEGPYHGTQHSGRSEDYHHRGCKADGRAKVSLFDVLIFVNSN